MKLSIALVLLAGCATQGMSQPPAYYPKPVPQAPPVVAGSAGPVAAPPVSSDPDLPITPDQPMPAASYSSSVTATLGTPIKALVDGRSDIYSAALAKAEPQRAGVMPAFVALPSGKQLAVAFSHVVGKVGCGTSEPPSGPDGGGCAGGSTDLESASGLSGIVDHGSTQFLVGVFLAGPPRGPAPARLDFGKAAQTHNFHALRPELGQTFYVGDGQADGKPQLFFVPSGATVLALGIADGYSFTGAPGAYGDNTGGFGATLVVDTIK